MRCAQSAKFWYNMFHESPLTRLAGGRQHAPEKLRFGGYIAEGNPTPTARANLVATGLPSIKSRDCAQKAQIMRFDLKTSI